MLCTVVLESREFLAFFSFCNFSQNLVLPPVTKNFALISGTVKSVSVEVGQIIGEGAECCVLEAMKMQNSLKIGATGTIKAVHVKPGDTVQADQVLVELEWLVYII